MSARPRDFGITFRVGHDADGRDPAHPWRVYDSDGWCRALARTESGATNAQRAIENGASAPILAPLVIDE